MSKKIRGDHSHLTLSDRITIEQRLNAGCSFREIARVLHKDPSTISKEVQRNRFILHEMDIRKPCDICVHKLENCVKQKVCRSPSCVFFCKNCIKINVINRCKEFKRLVCNIATKPPYTCNSCNRSYCRLTRYGYSATTAHRKYQLLLRDSRKGIDLTPDDLQKLNDLISPLVLQGQPLSHIFATHKDEIPCCRRTLYNYFDRGIFKAKNIDLPRRVRYKRRRPKKKTERHPQQIYRAKRTYKDFLFFMENHPDYEVVEMDTVMGSSKKGKCILTLLFRNSNFMLCILLQRCTQECVISAINSLTAKISLHTFKKSFKVILTDNGSEFKDPWSIEKTPDGKFRTYVFYCDPYESNQKGKLEKNHEFIRYIIPKGRSMANYNQSDISLMASHINSTARDALNGKSPYDLAELLLDTKIPASLGMHKVSPDCVILKPVLLKK